MNTEKVYCYLKRAPKKVPPNQPPPPSCWAHRCEPTLPNPNSIRQNISNISKVCLRESIRHSKDKLELKLQLQHLANIR